MCETALDKFRGVINDVQGGAAASAFQLQLEVRYTVRQDYREDKITTGIGTGVYDLIQFKIQTAPVAAGEHGLQALFAIDGLIGQAEFWGIPSSVADHSPSLKQVKTLGYGSRV